MEDNENEKENSEEKEQHKELKGTEENQLARVCFHYLQSFLSAFEIYPRLQYNYCKSKTSKAYL